MAPKSLIRKETIILPEGYEPTDDVVVIGGGRLSKQHIGNKLFRNLIDRMLHEYATAPGKTEKSYIVSRALHTIRTWNPGGIGFVKQNSKTGNWHSPMDSVARITVAQAFRDSLSSFYKSSRDNKMRRRQQKKEFLEMRCDRDTVLSSFMKSEIKKAKLARFSARDHTRLVKVVGSMSSREQPEVDEALYSASEISASLFSALSRFPFQETSDPFEPIPIRETLSRDGLDANYDLTILHEDDPICCTF